MQLKCAAFSDDRFPKQSAKPVAADAKVAAGETLLVPKTVVHNEGGESPIARENTRHGRQLNRRRFSKPKLKR